MQAALTIRSEDGWVDRAAYPFATRRVAVPGGSLSVLDEGSGAPIVFVHGTPTWSFEWRHLVAAFRGTHRCIAPDHLGFGLSDRPVGEAYTPEAHAERFAALVDALALGRFTLVVHDFGGPIALPYALAHPERIERLVVINSWMWPDPGLERAGRAMGGAFGRFLYRWANASLRLITPSAYGDRKKLTREIHRQYLAPFADGSSRTLVLWPLARALATSAPHYRALWDRRAALSEIPSLVVWGRRDRAFPAERFLGPWRESLPNAAFVELPASGHWPHEEQPDEVVAALRRFLA